MKKFLNVATCLLVSVAFVACDDAIPSIEIPLNKEISVGIDIPEGDTSFVYNKEQTIEAISDLKDYADKLEKITVDSITYNFSDLSGGNGGNGSDATFSGEIKSFSGSIANQNKLLELLVGNGGSGQISLDQLMNSGTSKVTSTNVDQVSDLISTLASTGVTFVTEVNGNAANTSGAPYTLKLNFTIHGKAEAKP
ncbi:hypothetical protein [Luteibaculum oceani]|uniref:DUF541 domain-containing protein n=1 Tax=Luteibaculum oceani TaxID=1294296 RepID=A0A5C6VIN7_9FLAO|nr:hypothetical protein [Luteibaculum oceani]TXC85263.1 hypothetical protein FRX97_01165 [Luteibaculum oceani]